MEEIYYYGIQINTKVEKKRIDIERKLETQKLLLEKR